MIQQFVQAGVNPGSPEYSCKSGEIMGVLKQMLENFKANLSDGDAAETKAQEEFDSLKAAKTEEINSGVALVKSKSQSLAKTNPAVSEAISILASDDSHDTFARTFSFVQTVTRD